MIVIFHALQEELGGVKIETERSVSIITGVGKEKTERILEKTFANYSVDKAIIIGIGGGLKKDFKIGDFILCNSVFSETGNKIYSDKNLLSVASEVLEEKASGEKLQKIISSLGLSLRENFLFLFLQKL